MTVQAERTGSGVRLRVCDDGKGIDAERLCNEQSWGIRGMLERARHFDGHLAIAADAGQGTTLTLELPLHYHHDNTDN